MSGPHDEAAGEDVGSVGEEAARLLGALSDWAREHGPDLGPDLGSDSGGPAGGPATGLGDTLAGLAGHAAAVVRDVGAHVDTGDATCTWCPVCRTVHLVRSTSPEVRDHLASAAASLMQAAAGFLVASTPGSARGTQGVERIDLDDEDGPWPEEER